MHHDKRKSGPIAEVCRGGNGGGGSACKLWVSRANAVMVAAAAIISRENGGENRIAPE